MPAKCASLYLSCSLIERLSDTYAELAEHGIQNPYASFKAPLKEATEAFWLDWVPKDVSNHPPNLTEEQAEPEPDFIIEGDEDVEQLLAGQIPIDFA